MTAHSWWFSHTEHSYLRPCQNPDNCSHFTERSKCTNMDCTAHASFQQILFMPWAYTYMVHMVQHAPSFKAVASVGQDCKTRGLKLGVKLLSSVNPPCTPQPLQMH